MTERVEVAIVGAGAVGLLLGCLLAQRGVDLIVLERRPAVSRASRAIGIHPPGLAALDAAGVGDAVRREAAGVEVGIALGGGRELARVPFGDRRILSLPQHRTEALLRERLAQLAPGALRTGAELVGLQQSVSGQVELELADGARVAARWAVGADGVRSTVRRLLGIAWQPRPGVAAYAMADAPDRTGAPGAALLCLEPDGIVESFPMPDGQRRWVARLPGPSGPTRMEPLSLAALQRLLRERLGVAPELPAAAKPSSFVARQRVATEFTRGRVALVGDAAHEISPIGGQGMSLGWLDAVAFDRALASAAPHERDGAALEGYARERGRAAARAVRRAAWNMRMGAPAHGAARVARLALVRILGLPPARSLLVSSFTMRGL
ncbi:FAD-dependent oxidoreductase [Agrococcus baldri]|uniref:FAD-dependent oxidoreductase n=1 Tax=Agrococcus baldri TaxID=153730 RepID=UPI0015A6F7B5|nr:NAD(P)/FAD-dependent oxidoreductase [Agrococcus baldri]